MIGVARGALEAATAYVKERKQFGKAIAEFQGIQFQLAQMATDLEAARLMVYNAARLKDAGQPFQQQAAMAKLFSSQVADRTTSNCLELFGGYGYSKEYPVEKFYRDAKIGTIYQGTSNMHLHTIAKTMLKSRPLLGPIAERPVSRLRRRGVVVPVGPVLAAGARRVASR